MISIRKAKIEDLKIIQDLNNRLCKKENIDFDSTVNPEFANSDGGLSYFKNALTSNENLDLIAEDNNTPVGYIIGGIEKVGDFRNIPNLCEVDNMWVDEKYRSQGIGKKFMNELEVWAKSNGIRRMRVVASFKNEKGIIFYKREGFEEYDLILEKDL
jgi:ribosomal protein S18 acetylase RimI-like enzyme